MELQNQPRTRTHTSTRADTRTLTRADTRTLTRAGARNLTGPRGLFATVRAFSVHALLICSMAACSKTSDAPHVGGGPTLPDGNVPSALVQALDTNTMRAMEQRTGTWKDADASSEWRAMASNGKVRMIDETMHVGETGTWRVTHYFTDAGKLAAYYEFRIQQVTSGDRPPAKQFVLFKLEFQNDTVSHSEKTVDNAPQPIQPFEIDNVRKHSMALFALAQSAPVTTPAKP